MERYLKHVKLTAKDGEVIVPPVCCANCSEQKCPTTCEKYETLLKNAKCTQVEMDFAAVGNGLNLMAVITLILLGCFVVLLMVLIWKGSQDCALNVESERYDTALHTDKRVSVAFHCASMGESVFTQTVDRAAQIIKELR